LYSEEQIENYRRTLESLRSLKTSAALSPPLFCFFSFIKAIFRPDKRFVLAHNFQRGESFDLQFCHCPHRNKNHQFIHTYNQIITGLLISKL
jgi:hypothetical protein